MKRTSKRITSKEDIDFLLAVTEDEACKLSFIMDCFGKFGDKERFQPFDIVDIPIGSYGPEGKKNKNVFTTTVGIWIFNKAFIEKELFDLFGYLNYTMTKKTLGKINKKLSYAVIEDKIPLDALKRYILKTQKFQPYCNILSPSLTEGMLTVTSKIRNKKKELLNKYKDQINKHDAAASEQIEKELLKECGVILQDDPAMDIIDSGAKTTWGNNFKNIFVMRGACKNPDPSSGDDFDIIKSNFMDGIDAEDYTTFANSMVNGPYSRAKKTEVGGAQEKQFVKAFEHVHVLPDGTDCGTKKTVTVHLTEDNIDLWMYSYIVDGGKLVELTSDMISKYLGKTVKFRYSAMCESKDGICSICAGHLFNRIGMPEVGVASYQIPSVIKVKSMKAFHDGTVKTTDLYKYGINKIFGLED